MSSYCTVNFRVRSMAKQTTYYNVPMLRYWLIERILVRNELCQCENE